MHSWSTFDTSLIVLVHFDDLKDISHVEPDVVLLRFGYGHLEVVPVRVIVFLLIGHGKCQQILFCLIRFRCTLVQLIQFVQA